jgi:hypothetical protein
VDPSVLEAAEHTVLEQEALAAGIAVEVVVGKVGTVHSLHKTVVGQHVEELVVLREVEAGVEEPVVLKLSEECWLVERDVDSLVTAPLPLLDSNISLQVSVPRVALVRLPNYPKLQDSERVVSLLVFIDVGRYRVRRARLLGICLLPGIIALLLLILGFCLPCCLCWRRLLCSMASSISHLFLLHHISDFCCLSKEVEITS